MSDVTPLKLPWDLPYPITFTRISVDKGSQVRRGDRLLEYSFMSATRRRDLELKQRAGQEIPESLRGNDMVGTWESPIDGEVKRWEPSVKPGALFERRQASKPIVKIEQPCTHPVQFNGMCGLCGANLDNDDYLSRPENEAGPSRYPGSFEMAHDASGVTVSATEAKRLETQSRDELLRSKKLSLIVDLDQTIIHTTVDPTVGEWLDECAEDAKAEASKAANEAQRQGKYNSDTRGEQGEEGGEEGGEMKEQESAAGKDGDGDDVMKGEGDGVAGDEAEPKSTTPPGSPRPKREPNPNAEALKDVARFQLAEDLPPGKMRGRGQAPSRWYYTKPRPGLTEFLADLSKLYEMHVYTMGTRTYADAICKIIDPDGKIFGGRILSRDESGSMSSKNLMRLFPTDQSMVVIIDDRSDVWGDSPNLVKVVPYDFFIGIGDINGSFLPPTQPVITMPPGQAPTPGSDGASSIASTPPPTTPSDIPSTEDGLMLQSKLLDEMTEARPLAKLERENEEKDDECTDEVKAGDETAQNNEVLPSEEEGKNATQSPDNEQDKGQQGPHVLHLRHPHHRKALLNPNDYELDRVGGILRTIHAQYYDAYDRRNPSSDSLPMQCDVPLIIQELKDQVLQGCVIGFTGVIPIHAPPEEAEIWKLAETFGAHCVRDLRPDMTHLVTANLQTKKMHDAGRMPNLKIVWLAWLQSCIALWKHEPEEPFRASHPAWERSREEREPTPPNDQEEERDSDEEFLRGAQAWDEAADAEFEAFLNESDDDGSLTAGEEDRPGPEGSKSPVSVIDNDERHTWSRASTPGPSILSRAPSPGRETPKGVVWADEENQPLERIREPQPGELMSYPPRKKRKILMLTAPTGDDDVPDANKLEFSGKMDWSNGDAESSTAPARAGSEPASEFDDDEFAKMLEDELAD
ncbi:hypothetical protein CC85DRAFT_311092 [Cutaneotrichosporon oleaginosum]|uniref:RNA polymerase II subunit A C-terminal domain phosphatase n=1 Tax=Cutaneotrichosporon oleaginosum TaxID=879819 RepID=A0A0J0XU00_9TREE|nr:uncharacterized protein CC85DRAFT_311092 [Cutaneotrichosporon oleaginosum]KLT44566.1 hypothetical protein CC85DRAFT_311092 [Cutaneotrichosporon oleaginosum]TXT13920.1 hypothetical protein COLE_00113 [Cutaneotrichosporon oleaginosum]